MFYFVFVALLALVATAAPSTSCDYVNSNYYLSDLDTVKDCFDTYTVSQKYVDSIIKLLDTAADMYPYVDIAKNPPNTIPGYFNTVDFNDELEKLKSTIKSSGNVWKKIIRPTNKFIAQFHDGHFSIEHSSVSYNMFARVSAALPFIWDIQNDDNDKVHLSWGPGSDRLSSSAQQMLQKKAQSNTAVKSIDGKDPFKFLFNLFGDYDDMKSYQGKLQYVRYVTPRGFKLNSYPLDDDMLFKKHTVTFEGGDKFDFNFVIFNAKNPKSRDDALGLQPDPFSFVTLEEELEARRILENYEPKIISQNRLRANTYVPCGTNDNMNYMYVSTFSPSGSNGLTQFANEIASCAALFDQNDYPISVIMAMNGGGYVALSQLLQSFLMPNTDNRLLFAIRKTDTNNNIALNYGVFAELANMDDHCDDFQFVSDVKKAYEPTVTDKFGNVEHKRSNKFFMTTKRYNPSYARYYMKKVRKPSDIIVATDGFCFSACSMFVNNVIRQGAAIVTGFGSNAPGDTQFVAAQCPSTVLQPVSFLPALSSIGNYGLNLRVTFMETYNISTDMKETTPGDYDILRIDKHLKYNNAYPAVSDVPTLLTAIKDAREEYLTTCNPLNKRLLLVDDSCKLAKNALTAGHPCNAEGKWDNSNCLISTCKPGYSVDFDNDKCVKNICDYRGAASHVSPMLTIVFILFSILAFFIY